MATTKYKRPKGLKLAKLRRFATQYLPTVPPENFDFARDILACPVAPGNTLDQRVVGDNWAYRDHLRAHRKASHPPCGAIGCAVGNFPKFYREFKWSTKTTSLYRKATPQSRPRKIHYADAATRAFGIPRNMAANLFAPNDQPEVHESLPELDDNATPKQVAAMLRKFCSLVEKGQINFANTKSDSLIYGW